MPGRTLAHPGNPRPKGLHEGIPCPKEIVAERHQLRDRPPGIKESLAPAQESAILEWLFRDEGEAIRHFGPTAQVFFALFGFGMDGKTISVIDWLTLRLQQFRNCTRNATALMDGNIEWINARLLPKN